VIHNSKMVTIDQIKKLRQETGVSIIECKKALGEAQGDINLAKKVLRKWGRNFAEKKLKRETKEGLIESYIHQNKKIGVMLELGCESDFVVRSKEFQKLAHELCLQIAAMNPKFCKEEDVPDEFLIGERKIYREQFKESGKSQKEISQIIEGKIKKYKEEIALLSQPWIKDETKTVKDLIDEYIARIGENIMVKRFVRYEI